MTDTGAKDITIPVDQLWSSPPTFSPNADKGKDGSFDITQGIIYKIKHKGTLYFQVRTPHGNYDADNEYVLVSQHGDEEGKWLEIPLGSFLKITGDFYIMNKTSRFNVVVAIY